MAARQDLGLWCKLWPEPNALLSFPRQDGKGDFLPEVDRGGLVSCWRVKVSLVSPEQQLKNKKSRHTLGMKVKFDVNNFHKINKTNKYCLCNLVYWSLFSCATYLHYCPKTLKTHIWATTLHWLTWINRGTGARLYSPEYQMCISPQTHYLLLFWKPQCPAVLWK